MDNSNQFQYRNSIKIVVFFLSILILTPVNLLIFRFIHSKLDKYFILNTFTVPLELFAPEKAERTAYLLTTLLLPFLFFTLNYLVSRIFKKVRNIQNFYLFLSSGAFMLIGILFYFDMNGMAQTSPYFYISKDLFFNNPIAGIIIYFFILVFLMLMSIYKENKLFNDISRHLFDFISLCLVITIVVIMTFGSENDPYILQVPYEAYFYSIVQVFYGKTLLVDFLNQYGFYPYFLEPIFKIIGLNNFNFSLVMAIITGLVYICIYVVLKKVTKNILIAFCGFSSIIFQKFFQMLAIYTNIDYYFQYYPHRMIFPAVFILLATIYIYTDMQKIRKTLYVGIFIVSSLALFWNMDTGIIVFAAWPIVLIYEELLSFKDNGFYKFINKCLMHIIAAFVSAIFVTAAFILYTYIRSGILPDLFGSFSYVKYFYEYGYYMIPMKLIHPWNLVILCYFIGLFDAVRHIKFRDNNINIDINLENNKQNRFIFLLSILGIGLFSYFQGRSHDYNLLAISWPAVIILTIYADKLYERIEKHFVTYFKEISNKIRKIKAKVSDNICVDKIDYSIGTSAVIFILIFFMLSSSIPSICVLYSSIIEFEKWKLSDSSIDQSIGYKIDFVNSHTKPGEQVFIISENASIYYMNSQNTNPVNIPSFIELFLKSDHNKIIDYINNSKDEKIIYDNNMRDNVIYENLLKNFIPVAASKDNSMILLKRKYSQNPT